MGYATVMRVETDNKRGVFTATVIANEALCREHFLLRLRVANFPPSRPGQFVQLQCRPPTPLPAPAMVDWPEGLPPRFSQPELTNNEPLLRRPFSLAGRKELSPDKDGAISELQILYRTVGTGTAWLAQVAAGATLSILGPLGNSLPIVEKKPLAVLVGGGVGIPPMLYLAEALQQAGKESVAFCGARTKDLLPLSAGSQKASRDGVPTRCCAEFERVGVASVVATDDGTIGLRGFVTEAFERWLDQAGAAARDTVVYSCGPEEMMRRVGQVCVDRGIECYLSLERNMACGMGTCQSCVVKIRDNTPAGWSYQLCCKDGPVFPAERIVW